MLNLFSLSSYVQFLGAFNFANVYSPFQDKLFKHFLNIDEMFSKSFYGMRGKIRSDVDSVNSMDVIETTSGQSNAAKLAELRESLSSLLEEEKKLRTQTKKTIKNEYTMKYSRPMFMSFGLYCTFELLTFGFMDMLKAPSIYPSFALYNFFIVMVSLYYICCEIFNMKHWFKDCALFKPTHWRMMIVSISMYLVFFANACVVELFGSVIEFPMWLVEWMCYSCILIPAIPFFIVFSFTYAYYKRSKKLIVEEIGKLSCKFADIHASKTDMDKVFSMFSRSEVSYGELEIG